MLALPALTPLTSPAETVALRVDDTHVACAVTSFWLPSL